jgi:hypothetical protein
MSKKYIIAIFVLLGVALLLGALFLYPKSPYPNGALDEFARCLASKGIAMYGAYWCPHCQNEKALFGDSFKYVNYVECTKEIAKCESANIQGYPAWTFPDGRRLEGEQKLEDLSAASGCALPTLSSSAKN